MTDCDLDFEFKVKVILSKSKCESVGLSSRYNSSTLNKSYFLNDILYVGRMAVVFICKHGYSGLEIYSITNLVRV